MTLLYAVASVHIDNSYIIVRNLDFNSTTFKAFTLYY